MRRIAAAGFLALLSVPASAQAARETLAEAVASALSANPSLQAERRTREGAAERVEQARAAGRPSLALNGSYSAQKTEVGQTFTIGGLTFPSDGQGRQATAGLEARQTLYAGGAVAAQRRQAEAGSEASGERLRSYEQGLILDVVAAYVDVRRSERELAIREDNVASLKQQVQAARDRFDVGEVTRTDIAQAEARLAGAEANLAGARAGLEASRAAFERLVGRAPVQLAEPPSPPAMPASLDDALAEALRANPDVVAARAAASAAEAGVDIARGALRPRLGLVGRAGVQETRQDQTFRDTSLAVSAELSIPLYTGGFAGSKTRESRLDADRARFEAAAIERAVTAQVASLWHSVTAARQSIAASRSQVAAAEIALEGAKQELAVGTRITLDVLDQERELREAQLGLINAERSEYVAIHEFVASLGRLTPELIAR
jgi:outer membrane protein